MQFFPNMQNTCTECGTPCNGVYAKNRQEALAGLGKCESCAGLKKVDDEKVIKPKVEVKAETPTKSKRRRSAKAKATS